MRNPRRAASDVGVLATLLVCLLVASGTVTAAGDESLTVFLNLPVTNGFSDATQALVETRELVRDPLAASPEFRLVDRAEDADVVLTVLGRGKGDVELTAALRGISRSIVAPPVPIAGSERYIEVLLTTGKCRMADIPVEDYAPETCYRRIFVGVGFGELGERRSSNRPKLNSWEACAEGVIRDVRAWLVANAERLRALRATISR